MALEPVCDVRQTEEAFGAIVTRCHSSVTALAARWTHLKDMAKKIRTPLLSRSFQRALTAMTRTAMRAGTQAVSQALRAAPKGRAPVAAKKVAAKPARAKVASGASAQWRAGVVTGPTGVRRYWLYTPPGVLRSARLPLLVMLHGCTQDAQALAASSQMNRMAARERFVVLYPEQDRFANAQGCWNWYDTRSGRAQGEASSIDAAIDHICRTQPVDPARIALVGLSAGAGMAALMASRHPNRYQAIAMHSGIAPGVAHSSASALGAMLGHRSHAVPLGPLAAGAHLPALLVIQGDADPVVAARNGAKPSVPRTVQRGTRYAATLTDYRHRGQLVATLCLIQGLGHAWSGGAPGQAFSDPKGPDASRMIWAFAAKQFACSTT